MRRIVQTSIAGYIVGESISVRRAVRTRTKTSPIRVHDVRWSMLCVNVPDKKFRRTPAARQRWRGRTKNIYLFPKRTGPCAVLSNAKRFVWVAERAERLRAPSWTGNSVDDHFRSLNTPAKAAGLRTSIIAIVSDTRRWRSDIRPSLCW